MTRISAADNIIIDVQPQRWRMMVNTNFVENVQGDGVLAEATEGQPLRYVSLFAKTRRLPKSGILKVSYIRRVVLGWSWDDDAWHLGLLLETPLAQARGSRWCELAKWPDPEQDVFKDLAVHAGESLARVINRPFNIIPIREQHRPAVEEAPLPGLPVTLEGWEFGRSEKGWFEFVRNHGWQREYIRRALSYSFWAIVYVVLALATLRTGIALPRPEFLPYVGLVTALLLLIYVIYLVRRLRTVPTRLMIDPQTRQIWSINGEKDKPIWRLGRAEIDSVYVSQVVRYRPDKTVMQHGELNLRLTDGKFFHLFKQEEPQEADLPPLEKDVDVHPLVADQVFTDVQTVGAYVARALDVPCWYDQRTE